MGSNAPGQKALVADAATINVHPKRIHFGDRMAIKWVSTCQCCETERAWGWPDNTSTRFMLQNMERAGWTYDKKLGLVCDVCNEKAASKEMSKVDSINPKLQRKVFNLLDDHFDEDKRLYRAGWSDKKIADEAQTSEQFVTSLRKGAYGELAEDPAITMIRADINALSNEAKAIADQMLNRMGEIEAKITQLRERLEGYAHKRVA